MMWPNLMFDIVIHLPQLFDVPLVSLSYGQPGKSTLFTLDDGMNSAEPNVVMTLYILPASNVELYGMRVHFMPPLEGISPLSFNITASPGSSPWTAFI